MIRYRYRSRLRFWHPLDELLRLTLFKAACPALPASMMRFPNSNRTLLNDALRIRPLAMTITTYQHPS